MKRGDPGRLRTLIVDDERPARTRIRHLLSQEGDFEVVGEASDGYEAARLIEQLGPDLVFLDIRMPGKDGFEVLEAVESERRPWVVFVTAYDDHAVRAFQVFALDYLLKPFDEDRFRATLERVRRHLQLERDDELHRKLSHLLSEMRTHGEVPERLVVRSSGRVFFLPVDTIERIEAAGNYVLVCAEGREHLVRETLSGIAEKLDPVRFIRIHRSHLVNVAQIREVRASRDGTCSVVLANGRRLRVGRLYRERLEKLF